MFHPAAQWDKHHQHGRCLEERDRTEVFLQHHGRYHHAEWVEVGDGGRHDDEYIHVRGAMFESFVGLDVEVTTSDELKQ